MFKYNNNHIFTGYLKQLLSSVNIPTCKIYTKEFLDYYTRYGKEDPRVIESIDTLSSNRLATRINYLKNNELYNFFWDYSNTKPDLNHDKATWTKSSNVFYSSDTAVPGLTKSLHSPGNTYDSVTHEYLGDYLRFLRDYYNVDLMSMYNCFSNKIYSNIYFSFKPHTNTDLTEKDKVIFDSRDPRYNIYAFPVKLFSNYTIAISCNQSIEMFCGLYKTKLAASGKGLDKAVDLAKKTYKKINRTFFSQPFLYDKLNVDYWNFEIEAPADDNGQRRLLDSSTFTTRWDIINREQDLKLFIKIPTSCKSTIVVLEGDFRNSNNSLYAPQIRKSLTMDSCFAGENVMIKGITAAALRGYAPANQGTNIESFTNCYSRATLDGQSYYGLVGPTKTTNNIIACCYNANSPIAGSVSAYTDYGQAYKVINSYESFELPADYTLDKNNPQYKKHNQAVYVTPEKLLSGTFDVMPYLNTDNKYVLIDTYPELKIFASAVVEACEADTKQNKIFAPVSCAGPLWNQGEKVKPKYSDEQGWYEITNGAELAYVIENGGDDKYYKVTNDIYLNDPKMVNWLTGELTEEGVRTGYNIRTWYYYTNKNLKPFKGTIDGGGHVVYGLYINRDYTINNQANIYAGLLPIIAGKADVTIKSLGIDYAYVRAERASAFIGALEAVQFINKLDKWEYSRNYAVLNFGNKTDKIDQNASNFTPISRLQLLAFNTGESYPFADRLIEYLSKSVITPIDEIPDNIKRTQRVMNQNQHYFKIEGLWEDKMQKIIYDYLMGAGPFIAKPISSSTDGKTKIKLIDTRQGKHPKLGYTTKSTLYDVLGYIDKDAEKWYANWTIDGEKASPQTNIQNIDIYDGLFDI